MFEVQVARVLENSFSERDYFNICVEKSKAKKCLSMKNMVNKRTE